MNAFLSDDTVKLRQPTLDECELVRLWRNAPDVLPMLRTSQPLTAAQQTAFYHNVVCNPLSDHRYYALEHAGEFIGLGGLTYLRRVAGEGEISLILGPPFRRAGLGSAAVDALRAEAARLGLDWIVGESYDRNPARMFWVKTLLRCDSSARFEEDRMFFRIRVNR